MFLSSALSFSFKIKIKKFDQFKKGSFKFIFLLCDDDDDDEVGSQSMCCFFSSFDYAQCQCLENII